MSATPRPESSQAASEADARRPESADQRIAALSTLLYDMDEAEPSAGSSRAQLACAHQNKLVQVRLGIASSLFAALRAKHAPTAAHSLRVALGCSSWTLALDMTDEKRDEIEVAALLHDIGKIGVPDHLLLKPSRLSHDEMLLVEEHRQSGLAILAGCSASREILDAVRYSSARFDGRKPGFDRKERDLPLGARMVAIVDAFDSMTTDHVYRRAMSRERAMAELFECAGSQFDPDLVHDFCAQLAGEHVKFSAVVARRWLGELHPDASSTLWCWNRQAVNQAHPRETVFQQKLLESMHDAVAFIDSGLRIVHWNVAAERLTGLSASCVEERHWSPSLVELSNRHSDPIAEHECPVAAAIRTGSQDAIRLGLKGRNGDTVTVDAQITPVLGQDGTVMGATLLLHDASSQINLEERVHTLHEKATRDPLTQVANRAEFDRGLRQFVETHRLRNLPCSLIICDLDHFKKVNDSFGHQAGDEALVSFAILLRRSHRAGDLVARYGGEEFVLLCADCDNATAAARAEVIRTELAQLPQPALGGKYITASFGVTEIQGGDTPETMLRRADRALLQAKDLGRNTVVQLGSGIRSDEKPSSSGGWFASWFRPPTPDQVLERTLVTPVPVKMAAEKLRGFVADHGAEIMSIQDDHLVLKISGESTPLIRRTNDRPVPFCAELRMEETRVETPGREGTFPRTLVFVSLRPLRNRDRRRHDVVERARQLLGSLKSYLMAQEHVPAPGESSAVESDGMLNKAKNIFAPIFGKQQ